MNRLIYRKDFQLPIV